MRIFHIGNRHFVAPLGALGHDVWSLEDLHPGIAKARRPFDIREVVKTLPHPPDLVLVVDALGPQTLPYGLEDVEATRVFWAIDTHVGLFWQRHYAHLFDLVAVAQKSAVPILEASGVPSWWLPWGAKDVFRPTGVPRGHDVAFIGTLDPAHRPRRSAAIELLRRTSGVVVFGDTPERRLTEAQMAGILAQSKIVFNESILGDLNFRVFEAMASGALLLTDAGADGLDDFFTPGVHLDVYDGPEELVAKALHYLRADAERERIAAAGAAEVRAHHTFPQRMAELVERAAAAPRRDVAPSAPLRFGMTAFYLFCRNLADPVTVGRMAAEQLFAVVRDGATPEAAVALGDLMQCAGRLAGALSLYEDARRLDPTCVPAAFHAAELMLAQGRRDAATTLYRQGVAAAPWVTDATRRHTLDLLDAGDPTTGPCLHALGLVLQETGLPATPGLISALPALPKSTALEYFVAGANASPFHPPAADAAAWLVELGKTDAIPLRQLIVSRRPDDPDAHRALSRALRAGFQLEHARTEDAVAERLADTSPVTSAPGQRHASTLHTSAAVRAPASSA